MQLRILAGIALVGLIGFTGCFSSSGPIDVTGTVLLDNEPVGTGNDATIRFEPVDGNGKSAEGIINKGKYSTQLMPGNYKVSISWRKSTGKKARPNEKGPGSEAEAHVEIIPEKYNSITNLTAEVSSSTPVLDFKLTK